jgi:hypothetical protein
LEKEINKKIKKIKISGISEINTKTNTNTARLAAE